MPRNRTLNPSFMPLFAFVASMFVLFLDSLADYYLFHTEPSLFDVMFSPQPEEFTMRLLLTIVFIAFGFFSRKLMTDQLLINKELKKYQDHLQMLVENKTKEIQESNTSLVNEIEVRKKIQYELEELAVTDSLTSVYNRRKFLELLALEISRARTTKITFALILCDIDHFKRVNDRFGHAAGDEILKMITHSIKLHLRKFDIFARWGGEEFVLIIPEEEAEGVAEKIRHMIEQIDVPHAGKVTVSFGLAFFRTNDTPDTLINRADSAMYAAKHKGRNRVEIVR